MIDPVGPMVQQKLTSRLHVCIFFTKKIVKVFSITQSRVTHRRVVPPGPDRLPASQISVYNIVKETQYTSDTFKTVTRLLISYRDDNDWDGDAGVMVLVAGSH